MLYAVTIEIPSSLIMSFLIILRSAKMSILTESSISGVLTILSSPLIIYILSTILMLYK